MPAPASTGLAETVWPFVTSAPPAGAVRENAAGPVVSGVTVNVSEAVRPAPEKAVTVCEPERSPKA